jgi:hypothetical protein
MSYWIFQIASEFHIPQEQTCDSLEALLVRHRRTASPSEEILRAATLTEAFAQLGWVLAEDAAANVIGIRYAGATFSSSWPSLAYRELDFDAIAPYVRPGSFILVHVDDLPDLTQGKGYLEERIDFDGARARFSRTPRLGRSEGWDQLR